jgi:hypothetical protein
MRSPPAVDVRVAQNGPWAWAGWLMPAVTAGVLAHALLRFFGGTPSFGLDALLAGLVLFAAALRGSRGGAEFRLCWTGSTWTLGAGGVEPQRGACSAVLDLGDWVLLRWEAADTAAPCLRWVPVARRQSGSEWSALRVALRWAASPDGAQDLDRQFAP